MGWPDGPVAVVAWGREVQYHHEHGAPCTPELFIQEWRASPECGPHRNHTWWHESGVALPRASGLAPDASLTGLEARCWPDVVSQPGFPGLLCKILGFPGRILMRGPREHHCLEELRFAPLRISSAAGTRRAVALAAAVVGLLKFQRVDARAFLPNLVSPREAWADVMIQATTWLETSGPQPASALLVAVRSAVQLIAPLPLTEADPAAAARGRHVASADDKHPA